GGDGIKCTKSAVTISGGTMNIKASNDALQAETTVDISGGIINACGDRGITAIESINITGGTVLATATDNQATNVSSTQGTMLMTYATEWKKGNAIGVVENGTTVFSANPIKKFTYVLVSSPELKADATYSVLTGGINMRHGTQAESNFDMIDIVTEFLDVHEN
ncbi:MAG TPA: carbohydrate-binding domain-containing protein, partial [Clostridiales bacterium]|nr:carbohydrate-binding domain-containing protein [Clostridiales bacterium]